jgi:hypothetical protein
MDNKSILEDLLDFDFKNLITVRVIKVLYIISIIIAVLLALCIVIDGFTDSFFWGLIKLIIAVISFFVVVIYSRILLELVVVIFKISDDIAKLAGSKKISDDSADEGL